MANNFFRQPIHLKIQTKGKLRKHQRSLNFTSLAIQSNCNDLMILPSFISKDHIQKLIQMRSPRNNRGNGFFKKHFDVLKNQSTKYLEKQHARGKNYSQDAGSFRAIHTAHLSSQLSRAFPLRSITPIKPFRRGIKIHQDIQENARIDIFQLARTQNVGYKVSSTTFHDQSIIQPEVQEFPKQMNLEINDGQEIEEFYKYKQKKDQHLKYIFENSHSNSEQPKMYGKKIEPFKKYQIREIQRNIYTKINKNNEGNEEKSNKIRVLRGKNIQF